MSIIIPESIARRVREEAERHGMTPEEYILEVLTRDLDPEEKVRDYIEAARILIIQAKEELEKGDLRQVCEKIWGACALAIKAYVLARKKQELKSHKDLWIYKDEVVRELGEWVRTAFLKADSMHKNFYEGLATREDVEDSLKEVEKLVTTVSKALEDILKK